RPAVTARTGRVHPGPPAPAAHPARGDPQGRSAVVAGPGALRPARRPRPRRPRRRPGLRRAVPRPGRRAPRAPARTPARRPPAGAAAGPAAGLVEGSPMMRPAGDPTRPGWRSWAGVALLLQVLLVGAIALDVAETEPHKVPLAIVAPPVVADTLVDEVGQLPGEPFAPVAAASAQDARRALLAGEVRGVVVVDLAETVDTLLLDGAADATLNRAVADRVGAVEASRGGTVPERVLRAEAAPGLDRVRAMVLLCGWGGFALVALISFVRGPFARTLTLGVSRVLGVVAAAAAAGLGVAAALGGSAGPDVTVAAVAGTVLAIAALVTLALEALAGYAGLALSAALFVALALPLTLGVDPALLSDVSRVLVVQSPPGASLDALAAAALHHGADLLRPLLVLVSWALVALAVLLLTRRA